MAACVPFALLTIFIYRKRVSRLDALSIFALSFVPVINIISAVIQFICIVSEFFPNAARNIVAWAKKPVSNK